MVWAGANYPQEHLEDDDTWDCDGYGHEYQLLTRQGVRMPCCRMPSAFTAQNTHGSTLTMMSSTFDA